VEEGGRWRLGGRRGGQRRGAVKAVWQDEAEGCRNGIEPAPLSALDPSIVAPDCQARARDRCARDAWRGGARRARDL
jgi:hypothetical protein